jgi:hypothetical protein
MEQLAKGMHASLPPSLVHIESHVTIPVTSTDPSAAGTAVLDALKRHHTAVITQAADQLQLSH